MSWITERKASDRYYRDYFAKLKIQREKYLKTHLKTWVAPDGRTLTAMDDKTPKGACYSLRALVGGKLCTVSIDSGWTTGEYGERWTKAEMFEICKKMIEAPV